MASPLSSSSRLGWRAVVVLTALVALLPLGRLGAAWWEYRRDVGLPLEATPPQGYDGVRWLSADDAITASYVQPGGPAARAGLRRGDRLVGIDALPVDSVGAVALAVQRATGTVLAYDVVRDGQPQRLDVPVVRAPTFLSPLSGRLWAGAAWGFGLATLVHVLALSTVQPLARKTPRARHAAGLIAAALAWVGGNLLRIAWATLRVPGTEDPWARAGFDALTLVAVAGWIAFPTLLVRGALGDAPAVRAAVGRAAGVLWLPPAVLGGGLLLATLGGHVGPLPPDAFVVPVLFYVCVYVAAASALAGMRPGTAPGRRLRLGYAALAVLAVAGAAYAWRLAPAARMPLTEASGGVVTALQLVSVLPVVLVSLDVLRLGAFDLVLARGLRLAAALGAVFLAVVAGEAVLRALVPSGAGGVALALLVVAVLVVAGAAVPRLADWTRWRPGGRGGDGLDQFGERVRSILDASALAQEAADTLGAAFDPRSAVVFLRDPAADGRGEAGWIRAAFRPAPPLFTAGDLERVWATLRATRAVWSRNAELSEAPLPADDAERLEQLGVALAVPVADGDGEPVGLFVLARKARPLAVYTVADVSRLRGLGGQLALAAERLRLVEREKALVRQTAEAELVALRAQINPHFLFNALNTVAARIGEQPQQAEQTVEDLAGLFRDVLTASGRPFVSLADELRLVRRYLAVEGARFGDHLAADVAATPEALARTVPAFSVQTLVENAVKHGIERRRGGGRVRVGAHVDPAGALVVTVADTGAGIPALFTPGPDGAAAATAFFGVGLRNVADRLALLYPDGGAHLAHASSPDGTLATLTLPPC